MCIYTLEIKGTIDKRMAERLYELSGLEVVDIGQDTTVVSCRFDDQSALYGAISRIRDMGLELVRLDRV